MKFHELGTESVGAFQWVVDREADAAYLSLSNRQVAETVSYDLINVDLDSHGCVVGVELLTLNPEAAA